MPEPLVAHGGHWLVQAAELAPVAILVIWLVVKTARARRAGAGARGEESERAEGSGQPGGSL